MSILLSVLCIWTALNLAIVAAMHFKPLRARGAPFVNQGRVLR
jgi:hypothetical protein